MVYKKYIYKNGKKHGPYYYESYREGDKVKKRYIGTTLPKNEDKKKKNKKFSYSTIYKPTIKINKPLILRSTAVIMLLAVVLVLGVVLINNNKITGLATYNSQSEEITIQLMKGELLPTNTQIIIDGTTKNLEEIITSEKNNGNYYLQGTNISGLGEGWGSPGTINKETTIIFKYKITNPKEKPAE
ncbi:hypothetical protein COU61_02510, partial [Candidatus Pacearchaeota archaeon CG10_big_fil_rev_8_21_14_0_10_35_13]